MNISTTRESKMFRSENRSPRIQFHPRFQFFSSMRTTPRPSIAKDSLWNDMKRSGFRTLIGCPNTNESFAVVFIVFGVFDDDVPVTIFVETICVEDFEFSDFPISIETFLYESFVGVFDLRVFVEVFHVGMGGSRVLLSVK